MNRRSFLITSTLFTASQALKSRAFAAPGPQKSSFGVCIYSYGATRKFEDTIAFLDHCQSLGAAGIQMQLTSHDPKFADSVRAKAAEYGMYYEGIVALPAKEDAGQFEQQIIAAKTAGARLVRSACLGTRRYETFKDLAAWKQFVVDSDAALGSAIPVLEKHQVALALENHKDWTVDEMLDLLSRHKSDSLGVCLDFGNNLALLDNPDAVMKLAPYAIATHVKDIAVGPDPGGFRMAEVPIGKGIVDVRGIVQAVRRVRPDTRLTLEMITRDPLLIPCLSESYWTTFPDRGGVYLARALSLVHERGQRWMERVSQEPPPMQMRIADDNLKLCLDAGRGPLAI